MVEGAALDAPVLKIAFGDLRRQGIEELRPSSSRITIYVVTDDEIIERLRDARTGRSATELANLLEELRGESSGAAAITFFRRAFPDIPLRPLVLSIVKRYGSERSDVEFDRALSEWLGKERR